MAISGLGVGVAPDRLSDLLQLVTTQNPFHRRRLESLDLGDDPALTELVHDQERHPPFGTNLTYPLDRYTQLHQTSGTTGPPLRVLDTADDWSWWRERFAHTLTVAGVGAGDRVALTYSFGPHVQFWAAKEGLEEVGAMAIALGGMGSTQRLQTIDEVGATAIWCTPTYALRLLEVAVEQRLDRLVQEAVDQPAQTRRSRNDLVLEHFQQIDRGDRVRRSRIRPSGSRVRRGAPGTGE